MKVYGLLESKDLDHRNDMAQACGSRAPFPGGSPMIPCNTVSAQSCHKIARYSYRDN